MDDDERLCSVLADDLDWTFEAVVLAHQDRLYSIALRVLGDPADAEEAAQDALVRAYRALATYDRTRILELRLRSWLTTIVLNRCRTVLSRRSTRPTDAAASLDARLADGLEVIAPATATPAAVAERRDARDIWADRLLQLPLAYRSAIVVRHVDGLSYPEAAIALGRPEGTVKAQVHRGVAMLRSMLEAEASAHHQEMTA